MRQFIVHFGVHKTGTTAFQRFIQDNRETLTAGGLFIPRLPEGQDGNYQGLARVMAGEYDEYPNRVRRFLLSLEPVLSSSFTGDILISSEFLSSGKFRPYLSPFSKFIDKMGFKKVAIVVLRDQIGWFNSRISQKRKMIHQTQSSFREQVESMILAGDGDWDDLCRRLTSLSFETFVVPSNEDYKAKGAVKSLFEIPAIERYATHVSMSEKTLHNMSFGAKQLILADLVRDYVVSKLGIETHTLDREALRKIMAEEFRGSLIDVPFQGFRPDFRDRVRQYFKAGNEEIAKSYFSKTWTEIFPKKNMSTISPQTVDDICVRERNILLNIANKTIVRAKTQGLF